MTIYCHRCKRVVDLPAEGKFKDALRADYTTPATFQCLSTECWTDRLDEIGDNVPKLDKHFRLMDLSNATSEDRKVRLEATGLSSNLDEEEVILMARRGDLAKVKDGRREEAKAAENVKKAKAVKDKKADKQSRKHKTKAETKADCHRGHDHDRRNDHDDDDSNDGHVRQVGIHDEEDYDFNNPVVAHNHQGLPFREEDHIDRGQAPMSVHGAGLVRPMQRMGRHQRRNGPDNELMDRMIKAGIPGLLYNSTGRRYYDFVEMDDFGDGDQFHRVYERQL